MKNLNLLEEQLRRWRPRPPSTRLEERLFGGVREESTRPVTHDAWAWVAPLTAAWLSIILLMSLEVAPDPQQDREPSSVSHYAASAERLVPPRAEAVQVALRRNTWPKGIFEWTSTRLSISDRGSFLLLNTNRLRP